MNSQDFEKLFDGDRKNSLSLPYVDSILGYLEGYKIEHRIWLKNLLDGIQTGESIEILTYRSRIVKIHKLDDKWFAVKHPYKDWEISLSGQIAYSCWVYYDHFKS